MDRKTYLEKCQKASVNFKIPITLPDDLKVVCNGIVFAPSAYELGFNCRGEPIHMAVLHDLNSLSIMRCELADVEPFAKERQNDEGKQL